MRFGKKLTTAGLILGVALLAVPAFAAVLEWSNVPKDIVTPDMFAPESVVNYGINPIGTRVDSSVTNDCAPCVQGFGSERYDFTITMDYCIRVEVNDCCIEGDRYEARRNDRVADEDGSCPAPGPGGTTCYLNPQEDRIFGREDVNVPVGVYADLGTAYFPPGDWAIRIRDPHFQGDPGPCAGCPAGYTVRITFTPGSSCCDPELDDACCLDPEGIDPAASCSGASPPAPSCADEALECDATPEPSGECDLSAIEAKLDAMEIKLDNLEAKADTQEGKLDTIEAKLDAIEAKLDSLLAADAAELRRDIYRALTECACECDDEGLDDEGSCDAATLTAGFYDDEGNALASSCVECQNPLFVVPDAQGGLLQSAAASVAEAIQAAIDAMLDRDTDCAQAFLDEANAAIADGDWDRAWGFLCRAFAMVAK